MTPRPIDQPEAYEIRVEGHLDEHWAAIGEMVAPQGKVRIEPENLHTYLWPKIGQCKSDGQFEILKQSADWLEPVGPRRR